MTLLTVSVALFRKDRLCIQFQGVIETLMPIKISLILHEKTLFWERFLSLQCYTLHGENYPSQLIFIEHLLHYKNLCGEFFKN